MVGKNLLSLDIGNDTIKIVSGWANKKNIILNEYGIINTPDDCINDGMITDADKLSRVIAEALKTCKISGKGLVLTVTGTGVITRDIMLPKSTEQEITQILEFEAQQYFPVNLKDYTVDFKVMENIEDQIRVLVVAAPNKQIDSYISLSKHLKLQIAAIDIPSNCILKLLSYSPIYGNETTEEYAVVDIGKDTSGVCFFRNNVLKFSRILLNGVSEIDSIIANKYNLEYKNAEELKKAFRGFSDSRPESHGNDSFDDLGEVIRGSLDNLVADLNRFIEFYNSRDNLNNVEKIYVYGGGSKLAGITEYFSNNFNMPVLQFPLLQEIVYKGRKEKDLFQNDYPFLINAIGGLVRAFK
ncbi:MAG TPA: type IV pilus assembly protein PilM [Ruminiclostridium sp.]|nr:type IV pilus assembly protein PilM [Ruminiclostridium sp.]